MGKEKFFVQSVAAFLLLFGFPFALAAQSSSPSSQPPVSDPQALILAATALRALTGGSAVQDATLSGTEERIAGSTDETEPVNLEALGTDNSKIVDSSSGRSETRTASSGTPVGEWVGTDGNSHQMAFHNCITDAAWFFPAFSSAFTNTSNVLLNYIGQTTLEGESVQHIRMLKPLPNYPSDSATTLIVHLSQTDIYLDANSFLPVEFDFNVHPDQDAGVDIPVRVTFSTYQLVSGIQVPFHVQFYINNSLNLDIQITSVTINSGLSANDFLIQ